MPTANRIDAFAGDHVTFSESVFWNSKRHSVAPFASTAGFAEFSEASETTSTGFLLDSLNRFVVLAFNCEYDVRFIGCCEYW